MDIRARVRRIHPDRRELLILVAVVALVAGAFLGLLSLAEPYPHGDNFVGTSLG